MQPHFLLKKTNDFQFWLGNLLVPVLGTDSWAEEEYCTWNVSAYCESLTKGSGYDPKVATFWERDSQVLGKETSFYPCSSEISTSDTGLKLNGVLHLNNHVRKNLQEGLTEHPYYTPNNLGEAALVVCLSQST